MLSRPSYTGYSRTRNGKVKPFPFRADTNELKGILGDVEPGTVSKFGTFEETKNEGNCININNEG